MMVASRGQVVRVPVRGAEGSVLGWRVRMRTERVPGRGSYSYLASCCINGGFGGSLAMDEGERVV